MFIRYRSKTPPPAATGPVLGHTPSLKYQPLTRADRKTDEHLQEMIRFRERTGDPHPDLPTAPAGIREMTGEEAAATRLFRERYFMTGREANIEGSRWDFERHEFYQTYRREGDDIVANQDRLVMGGFNFVEPQSGRFPAGTRIDIHSHPDMKHPSNAIPSDLDQRVAHQLRTNALHRPGTRMSGAIMYYPPLDTFFAYSGELTGRRKRPEFHELADPFPLSYRPDVPDLKRARMRVPDAPRSYIAYHPDSHRPFAEVPSRATFTPPVPGPAPRDGMLSPSFPQRRALSADSRPLMDGIEVTAEIPLQHPQPRRAGIPQMPNFPGEDDSASFPRDKSASQQNAPGLRRRDTPIPRRRETSAPFSVAGGDLRGRPGFAEFHPYQPSLPERESAPPDPGNARAALRGPNHLPNPWHAWPHQHRKPE